MQTLNKKLTLNTVYQFTGKGLSILLALITLGILSRYLGVKGMGEYGTILRYLGFVGIIADLGLNVIVTREISKIGFTNKEKILANAFGLRIFSAFLLLGISLLVGFFLPYSEEIKIGLMVGSCTFFFILLTQIFNGVFQKNLETQKSTLADIVSKIVILFFSVYLILQNADLLALLWATNLGTFCGFVLTLYFAKKHTRICPAFDLKIWRKLLIYAWPVALSNFLILIYFNVDALMLSWMRPLEEVGLYHVAYKILETVFQFIVLFVGLFVPLFTQTLEQKIHFKKHLQTAFNGILFFGIPLFFSGLLLSKDLMHLAGGAEFTEGSGILQVLLLAAFFLFINHLMHNVLTVLELQKKALWIYAFGAILNLTANLYAIPNFGAIGAAYTTVLSELFICIAIFFFFVKHAKFYPDFKSGFKILAFSFAMFLAILSVNQMPFIFKLCIGALVYFGLAVLFLRQKEVS